jgi:hypothetical protein
MPDAAPAAGGDGLDGLRATAERLLAAGNDVIDRALSGDSEAFLRANEQHGGE